MIFIYLGNLLEKKHFFPVGKGALNFIYLSTYISITGALFFVSVNKGLNDDASSIKAAFRLNALIWAVE